MNSISTRKQTSFRLNAELLSKLQEEAKLRNRSLNNLVESILITFVSKKEKEPSAEEINFASRIYAGMVEAKKIINGESKGYHLDDVLYEL